MTIIKTHYRITRHVMSSVYELACTLVVTHRRARRLALYTNAPSADCPIPW